MWTEAVQIFQKYMGTGLIVIWFLAALSYVLLNEKQRPKRIFFVYMPVIMLLIYFNPLFVRVFFSVMESEIYFRMWWLVPVIIVIAYAAVCICDRLRGKGKGIFATTVVAMIILSGKLVYSNPLYSRAENSYHVPESVVEICDAIVVPGREVMAAFPSELVLYVRQYAPRVCMPYGRDDMGQYYDDFYHAMQEDEIDLEVIMPFANEKLCHYLIFRDDKEILGSPQDFGLDFF